MRFYLLSLIAICVLSSVSFAHVYNRHIFACEFTGTWQTYSTDVKEMPETMEVVFSAIHDETGRLIHTRSTSDLLDIEISKGEKGCMGQEMIGFSIKPANIKKVLSKLDPKRDFSKTDISASNVPEGLFMPEKEDAFCFNWNRTKSFSKNIQIHWEDGRNNGMTYHVIMECSGPSAVSREQDQGR